MKECEESAFVANSRVFVNSLVMMPDKMQQILQTMPNHCKYCDLQLEDWKHKTPKSYFLSMGNLKEIKIQVKVCPKCRRAFYPSFYKNGIIFIHNKFVITIEFILDLSHILQTGGGFVEAIKKKWLLLGKVEGLDKKQIEMDINSNALKLEKIVIAVMTLMMKGSDLDAVTCLICGNSPKICSTDGNTKDSIKVRSNMEYNYEDTTEVPNLNDFKEDLIEDIFMSVFFQQKMDRKYNILKLPIISAPCLIKKQINNDFRKQTLMEKEFKYEVETLDKFMKLVETREIRISRIAELSVAELKNLSKQLGIYNDKKSGELMKIDLLNLSKIFLGGQVNKTII